MPTKSSFRKGGKLAAAALIVMLVMAVLPVIPIQAAPVVTTYTTSGSHTWTAPAGVTSVTVEVWGGGGKGGTRTSSGDGGGGGGGAYSIKTNIVVIPGNTYTAYVGAGATTTAAGGDSYFINTSTVMAKGGSSVADNTTTGSAGGQASAGVGDTKYSGGTGANATGGNGGGGGSSAGTGANGANGSGSNGGNAPAGGGDGGDGRTGSSGDGTDGSAPGGGGGGAHRFSGTRNGGDGADGRVRITYDDSVPPTVTVEQVGPDPTTVQPINFTVTFSEPITGFTGGDVILTGTAGGLAGATKTISGTGPYNIAVSGLTAPGTVIASIGAGAVTDVAGNGNTASTSIDNTVTLSGYTITASAGAAGVINPNGAVNVFSGANQAFNIAPNATFIVSDVLVDASSAGRANSYTFSNVTANHTITASFDGGWRAPNGNANVSNWSNPGNAYVSDNNNTTATIFFGANSVDYNNFGISIPAGSTIDGIEVAVEGRTTGPQLSVSVSPDGTNFSAPQSMSFTGADATNLLGDPTDQWGLTWTTAGFTNFTVRVSASGSGFTTFFLDQLQVKVHYRQPTTLSVSAATGTYGGTVTLTGTLTTIVGGNPVSGQTVNFYLNGISVGSAVTNASGTATLNAASLAGINVGAYAGTYNTSGVGANFADNSAGTLPGYLGSTAANTLTVNQAQLTVTANDQSRAYGAANPVFDATITGFANGENLGTSDVTGAPSCTTTATQTSPVGMYPITCAIGTLASNNYSFTFTNGTLTIDPADLLITASSTSMTYGGAVPIINPIYSGLQAGDTQPATPPTCTTTATSASPVGPYPSTCSGAADSNYTITYAAGTVNVTPAVLTVTANDKSRPYGAANPAFDAAITGFVNGEDINSSGVTGAPSCTTTATPTSPVSGSPYAITCTIGTLAASNYSFTFADGQLTITSATLTVTANDKSRAYGAADPLFDATITGFVNGENLGTSDVTGAPSCTTAATASSPVSGSPYPITCSIGTLASTNYSFTFADGQLTITSATLTVTANDKSRAYGAADPVFDATITGFVNGENLGTSDVTGAPSCTTTATQTSPAGIYPITCTTGTLASSNYSFTFASGTLTISPVALTVTANEKFREYGLSNPTLDAVITGFANGEDLNSSDVTGAPDCTTTATIFSPVGDYPITCSIGTLASNNYTFTFTDGQLHITQAALTITASSHSLSYGDPVPPITPGYSGLRAGDLAPATPPTCSTTATDTSPVGSYPSTCSGAVDPNYTISYVGGTVTIGMHALLITASDEAMVYGGAVPAISPIYSGLQAGDTQPATPPTCSTTATSTSPVGPYSSTCSGAADPNYVITYAPGTVTVTQAALDITASSETMIYGDAVPAITPSYTGFVAGDNEASLTTLPTCSTTATSASFVGSYPSTCSGAASPNYIIGYTDGTVTVNKRAITVTAVTDTKAYDGDTSSVGIPNITSGILVNGDTANFTQTFDTPTVGIGKTLTPGGAVNDGNGGNNYNVTFVQDNTGSIVGITVTVTGITADNKVYDGTTAATLNTGGALLVGVVSGDDVQLVVSGATGNFANKNVGNGKTVNITGLTLTGADIANYGIIPPTTTANITTRPITVTAQTNTKVYDSTTSSAAAPSITVGTLAGGDTPNFTQSYDTPNVGTSKTLTPGGAVNDGNGGGNYLITFENNTTGVITARPLTITADPKSKAFGAPDPIFTYSITNGSLAGADFLSGSLTRAAGEAVGTYAILQGSLTAGSNYNITYAGANLTISIVNQTITVVTSAPASAAYNTSFNVAATASSGLPVAITTTGSCTGSGSSTATIIIVSGTGTCTVHYNQAGDANYNPAIEVTETTAAQKANQVITVNTAAPANATYNTGFNVAAVASSGLPVAYSSTGVCSNAGSNFTMTSGTGTCTVHFNQAGDVNYNAAAEVTEIVNAQKANQSISIITSAPANAAYNSNFTVAATASSGLAVAYTSGGSCTNGGTTTYTMTGSTGTCSVIYNQAGNANYNAAPQITQTVNAQKANQTITVTTSAPPSAANGSNFTVAATASSGLPVAITTSGFCTGGGSGSAVITMTSGTGSCTVNYDQAGNANYNAAPQVSETVNSTKANQTISVTTSAPATAINGAVFNVAASASSGLPVAVTTSGVCTGGGTGTVIVTMTSSSGTCTVHYDQAGNTNYNPAPQVNETVNAVKANQTITITTNAPGTAANGSNFTVAATASSGLPVTYTATGSCSNSGAIFTMTSGAGTCTVHYNQAGNIDFNAATELTEGVTAQKGNQTITVTTHAPVSAANGSSFNVAATASSGLPVAITSTGVCSGSGTGSASITVNASSGNCTVHYNQAGNVNDWNAAPEVTEDTNALPSAQTITVTTQAPASSSMGSNFDVAANASSGLTVSITVSGGVCSSVDHGDGTATITITNTTGTCTVHYNQAGDSNYAAAPEVTEAVILDSVAPTVTINQAAAQADPTNGSPIDFTAVFSKPVTGFTDSDVIIGGTAGATTASVTEIAPNDGTTYNVAISGMSVDGTVSISIPAGAAKDASNNINFASSSTDNVVTYFDGIGPSVAVNGVNTSSDTGDGVLNESEVVAVGVTQFTLKFNQDVYNPAGDSDSNDVTNPNNYLLVRDLGDTAGFQTASCAGGAQTPADTNIAVNNVTYDSATFTATITVNSSLPLSNGSYRLYVCGTTSIVDPLDIALKLVGNSGAGSDFIRNFSVNIANNGGGGNGGGNGGNNPRNISGYGIPVTGFAPGRVTQLPKQPANLAYSNLNGVRLEIPVLSVNVPIVGVNLTSKGWDLTWLENNAGYLQGSAYPTWAGNSVLTGHVLDASNAPGPFAYIKDLQIGDRVMVHMGGYVYVYEVQENRELLPSVLSAVFQHEEYNWITLVTCEDYNLRRQSYNYRRIVRAILVSVVPE